jgi:Tfp pilus assembly protein PilO
MTKVNFQSPIFIITIISFIGTIAIGNFFLWPRFQELEIKKAEIVKKEQGFQDEEVYFLTLEENRRKLKEYQKQLFIIESALPDNAEASLSSLFKFLQIASTQAGLILTEIEPFTIVPSEKGATLEKTQFSFQVTGSYASFKTFLAKIEKSARIIKVENISFSSPKENKELFAFNLKIKTYSYKEPSIFSKEKIKIDRLLEVLRKPIFEKFELFPAIELKEMGRENPFTPF